MVLSKKDSYNYKGQVKQHVKNYHKCPYCKEMINVGIEQEVLDRLKESSSNLYSHIHLHGDPLHAMLCFIDKDLRVRAIEVIESIEVSRDSETISMLFKKRENSF